MNLRSYVSAISFRAIDPEHALGPDRRLRIPRPGRADAKLLELPGAPLDVFNTVLPEGERETRRALAPTRDVPRMSTFAIGAVLNRAVAEMPADQVYVNVGVWQGFTYFSGALGNPGKRCIGVDNFSEWGKDDVRLALEDRLERIGTPSQAVHEMDYREYFEQVHREPIGVYLYDGDHAYEHQLRGLQIAEPFLADGCVIVVDDTNTPHPHRATLDFIDQSERSWEILLDADTSRAGHPTWWNGLMVIKHVDSASPAGDRGNAKRHTQAAPDFVSEPFTSDRPLVTLIVRNDGHDPDGLSRIVEQAHGQNWPELEAIVADEHPGPDDGDAIRAAIAESRGEFVGFVDRDAELRPSAIEMGLAFPRASRFNTELTAERFAQIEQSLAAGALIVERIPPGRRFVVASTEQLPHVEGSEWGEVFMASNGSSANPRSAAQLVDALDDVRRRGAVYIGFTRSCAAWLEAFPEFRQRLESDGRRVIDDERALVYELVEPT